jgi:ribonuclease J
MKAIPDDTMMNTVEGSVKAIVCSHGHLDHIGAIPSLPTGTSHNHQHSLHHRADSQQIAGEQKFGVNNKLFA